MPEGVLVTGATGLIGSALVRDFAADGRIVLAAVRNAGKAKGMFGNLPNVRVLQWEAFAAPSPSDIPAVSQLDIVHAASPTSGRFFVEHPAETERFIRESTRRLLEFTVAVGARGFAFLSSMEAYGSPQSDAPLDEGVGFSGDLSVSRASYARGKLTAERLCAEFARAHGLRAMSVRLAQVLGRGVPPSEPRLPAQFLRSALAGEAIRLSTAGTSTRMYLETEDAVAAIRAVLECGVAGEVYNAANPETYCSIAELAHLVARRFGGAGVGIGRDDDPANACYPPPHHLRLDVSKLMALGWKARYGLEEAFVRMAEGWNG